jgi:hypothetical protein
MIRIFYYSLNKFPNIAIAQSLFSHRITTVSGTVNYHISIATAETKPLSNELIINFLQTFFELKVVEVTSELCPNYTYKFTVSDDSLFFGQCKGRFQRASGGKIKYNDCDNTFESIYVNYFGKSLRT